jgi:hypothetical protein
LPHTEIVDLEDRYALDTLAKGAGLVPKLEFLGLILVQQLHLMELFPMNNPFQAELALDLKRKNLVGMTLFFGKESSTKSPRKAQRRRFR